MSNGYNFWDEWWLLEDKYIDHERERQLILDRREVRNEMIKQYYTIDRLTCKEIGKLVGLSESSVFRIITTGRNDR